MARCLTRGAIGAVCSCETYWLRGVWNYSIPFVLWHASQKKKIKELLIVLVEIEIEVTVYLYKLECHSRISDDTFLIRVPCFACFMLVFTFVECYLTLQAWHVTEEGIDHFIYFLVCFWLWLCSVPLPTLLEMFHYDLPYHTVRPS